MTSHKPTAGAADAVGLALILPAGALPSDHPAVQIRQALSAALESDPIGVPAALRTSRHTPET